MNGVSGPAGGGRQPHIRVAVLDDHVVFLEALGAYLSRAPGIEVVATLSRWDDFVVHPAYPAEVVLLDLDLQDQVPAPVKIRALTAAGARVVVLSSFAEPERVLSTLEAGAFGYVPKRSELHAVIDAITAAASGHSYVTAELAAIALSDRRPHRPTLSPQEQQVLVLYTSGLPLKSVARRAGISFHTARTYLDRVREKYDKAGRPARTKHELHQVAVQDGWADRP